MMLDIVLCGVALVGAVVIFGLVHFAIFVIVCRAADIGPEDPQAKAIADAMHGRRR